MTAAATAAGAASAVAEATARDVVAWAAAAEAEKAEERAEQRAAAVAVLTEWDAARAAAMCWAVKGGMWQESALGWYSVGWGEPVYGGREEA